MADRADSREKGAWAALTQGQPRRGVGTRHPAVASARQWGRRLGELYDDFDAFIRRIIGVTLAERILAASSGHS